MSVAIKKLNPSELKEVQFILGEARAGRASMAQLAHAHDLADGANLNGTLGELREHIRRSTPSPPLKNEGKAVVIGMISGLFTHLLLKVFDK